MVLAGRSEAFEPLVTPYRGPVLALAYRLTRDREVAREVAQEAFLKAFRSLGRFDVSRPFRNWLFQIAANEARDRLRERVRERAALRDAAGRGPARRGPGGRTRPARAAGGPHAPARRAQPAGEGGRRAPGPRGARHPGDVPGSGLLGGRCPGPPVQGPAEDRRPRPERLSPSRGRTMTCRKARKLIPLAAGDDLGPRRARAFRAHVEACPGCRKELEALRAALGAFRTAAREEGVPDWTEGEWKALMVRATGGRQGGEGSGRRSGRTVAALGRGVRAGRPHRARRPLDALPGPGPRPGAEDDGRRLELRCRPRPRSRTSSR